MTAPSQPGAREEAEMLERTARCYRRDVAFYERRGMPAHANFAREEAKSYENRAASMKLASLGGEEER